MNPKEKIQHFKDNVKVGSLLLMTDRLYTEYQGCCIVIEPRVLAGGDGLRCKVYHLDTRTKMNFYYWYFELESNVNIWTLLP